MCLQVLPPKPASEDKSVEDELEKMPPYDEATQVLIDGRLFYRNKCFMFSMILFTKLRPMNRLGVGVEKKRLF